MSRPVTLLVATVLVPLVIGHPFFGHIRATADDLLPSYDYVIVGAGASGLTVANRLSEDSNTTVLVIEAGEFDANEDFVTVPGLAGGAIGTKYDWNTSYAPNDVLGGREVSIPQGKVVGGSTKLNRMVFDRGSKSDYNRWEALGNDGWNWDSFLKYFKKNEIFTPPNPDIVAEYNITTDPAVHGTSGYMHSSYSPFIWPTTHNFVNAIKELGIHIPVDAGNGDAFGGYFCPHNQDPATATRSSAREAYYETVKTRANLHLITGSQVTRLLTKTEDDIVSVWGVEFASSAEAERSTVIVDKEAILAAGAIHTPQILQVSGIGDPALLQEINVESVVDLPAVGQNFQDHVLLAVVNIVNASLTSANLTSNATFQTEAMSIYKSKHTGPYSSPTGDFLAFLPLVTYSNESATLQSQAAAQNYSAYLADDTPEEVVAGYKLQHKVLTDRLSAPDSALLEIIWDAGTMVLGLQHPFSRGSVQAASASTFDPPIADPRMLHNPLDISLLLDGTKFARFLAQTKAISALQPVEVVPGANVTSDAALVDFIKQNAATLYHPSGSCKLGKREEGGVVDEQLKVYGVNGLRIVDASVMPLLPASHTMTTVYAVAEKAADIIRGIA